MLLHPNTVREHLDTLVREGLAARTRQPAQGRGRPPWTYAAAEAVRVEGRSSPQRIVADAMITIPKTVGVDISVADARQALVDTHVHMLLLTRRGILHGTLERGDLRPELDARRPAVTLAILTGRTIGPHRPLDEARLRMDRSASRRLAVTDPIGNLLGLLCLNQARQRYCTEEDVLARACDERPRRP